MRRVLIFIVFCLLPLCAFSADKCVSTGLDHLVHVASGGYWSKGKLHGYYRVLVYRLGWEHVHDEVQLQTILFDESKQQVKTLSCSVIMKQTASGPNISKVKITPFRNNLSKITITSYIRSLPGLEKRTVFIAKQDGSVAQVMETRFNQSALDQFYNRQGL